MQSNLEKILKDTNYQFDDMGRVVIENEALLSEINGAMASDNGFVLSDGACGNSNCVC